MTSLQKELEDQLVKRQKEWDAGEYKHSESIFNNSMDSDRKLLAMVLQANNGTVAPKQRLTKRKIRVQ